MKKICLLILIAIGVMTGLAGCESSSPPSQMPVTGFLSDYSGLEQISDTSYRYINPKYDLGNYTRFIVDPVEIVFNEQAKAKVKSWDEKEKLRAYMHKTFVSTLEPRYAAVAQQPGPKTARIRIALTNVQRSTPIKLGSASMEAELLDSQTNEQIAAIIESQEKGSPFGEYYDWENAKAIMDDWAKRLYNRLEEAHGH